MFQSPGYLWLLLLLPLFLWIGWPSRGKKQFSEWVALFLRSLLIVCLVLGLAELTIQIPNDRLSVLYLLDVSDSVSTTQQRVALDFIKQSIKSKPPDDLAGLIVFGGNALVEMPLSVDSNNRFIHKLFPRLSWCMQKNAPVSGNLNDSARIASPKPV